MLGLGSPEMIDTQNSPDGTVEGFRVQIEQGGVLGWTYDFTREITTQATRTTFVICPYSFSNHIAEVFGLGPYLGSDVTMRIVDGQIEHFMITPDTDA